MRTNKPLETHPKKATHDNKKSPPARLGGALTSLTLVDYMVYPLRYISLRQY